MTFSLRRHTWPIPFAASLALVACKKSPDPMSVCARMQEISTKDGAPLSAQERERCVSRLAKIKTEAPTGFDCFASCGESEVRRKDVERCFEQCSAAAGKPQSWSESE